MKQKTKRIIEHLQVYLVSGSQNEHHTLSLYRPKCYDSTCKRQQNELSIPFCTGISKRQHQLLVVPKKPICLILHLTTTSFLAYPILSLHFLLPACLHLKWHCAFSQLQHHLSFSLQELHKKTYLHIQPSFSSLKTLASTNYIFFLHSPPCNTLQHSFQLCLRHVLCLPRAHFLPKELYATTNHHFHPAPLATLYCLNGHSP